MKQIEVFPFSRDGYHYDVQPGYTPVFEHSLATGAKDKLTSPKEFGYLTVIGDSLSECETKVQDFIHERFTHLEYGSCYDLLNDKAHKILESFHECLNITYKK